MSLPKYGRDDFSDRWGADDFSSFSRYDGLKYIRLNPLGAWCLGVAGEYQPEVATFGGSWRVLPNLEIVSSDARPDAADALFLDRIAERTSEAVWRLDRDKILARIEEGLKLDEIGAFLERHAQGSLPVTIRALLDDLEQRSGRLRDLGTVRMIECTNPETARMLLLDPKLKTLCEPAGNRGIVFRATWNRKSDPNCENLVMCCRQPDRQRELTSVTRPTIRLLALLLILRVGHATTPALLQAQTIWVEGEKSARSTMSRHPWWYDQVKQELAFRKRWISNGQITVQFSPHGGNATRHQWQPADETRDDRPGPGGLGCICPRMPCTWCSRRSEVKAAGWTDRESGAQGVCTIRLRTP